MKVNKRARERVYRRVSRRGLRGVLAVLMVAGMGVMGSFAVVGSVGCGRGERCECDEGSKGKGAKGEEKGKGTETGTGKATAKRVKWGTLKGRRVLLVSHPSVRVLRSLGVLVRKKVLDVKGLYVVGLYHADEKQDYVKSRRFAAKEKMEWLGFHELRCELKKEKVFGKKRVYGGV